MQTIKFMQSFSNPFLDHLFLFITLLGEEFIPILILAFVFWCKDKKYGYKLGFILTFNIVFNSFIKDCVKAKRPIGEPGIRSQRVKTATGYSFPSGHTQNTTALFTSLAYETKKKIMIALAVILIVLVGSSRLYLGVHWPSDVLGGIIFGLISVLIGNYIFDLNDEKKKNRILVVLCIFAGLGNIIFKSLYFSKASGIFLGFILGYFVENKYINFSVKAPVVYQILKMTLGIFLIGFIRIIMKSILPQNNITNVFINGVIGFSCTAIVPYLFIKLKLSNKE